MTSNIAPGEAAFLGVVQGLTEFLPISSSGHLVAFQQFLGLRSPELLFDVVVHGGTLLAVLLVYGKDLWRIVKESLLAIPEMARAGSVRTVWRGRPYFRLAVYLTVGTAPAGFAGILFQDSLEQAFGSLFSVGCMLLITGTVLYGTKSWKGPGRDLEELSLRDCLVIGVAQALALMPGISRSGITIATGLFCGLKRDLSARYSFLLSVPAILGANLLQATKAQGTLESINAWPFVLGGLTALATGYVALRLLLRIVHRGQLFHFAYYCWTVGTVLALIAWMGPSIQ